MTDKTDKCDNTSHAACPKAKIVAKKLQNLLILRLFTMQEYFTPIVTAQ